MVYLFTLNSIQMKELIGILLGIIATSTFFGWLIYFNYCDQEPGRIIFKACLDKHTILNDSTICDCAEFVGHPEFCDGDIRY